MVLLADPDAEARALYRRALGPHGWFVEEAEDGTQALAKALDHCPMLVVTDAQLVTIDGYTLCELLRRDMETRNVPIVVLSGATYPADIERARLAGADAVFVKPCLPEQLIREMDWMIDHVDELRVKREERTTMVSRSTVSIEGHTAQPPTRVRAYRRSVTTAPPLAPPDLFCPLCSQRLAYDRSHLGGVSDRYPEQWDYYVCVKCGTFQYRQRTRKVRRIQ